MVNEVKQKEKGSELIAIIRVRGRVGVRQDIEETLKRLKLTKPNHLVIYPKTDSILGMIKKVNSYITWGEVDKNTLELLDKRATKETENLYRLSPPRKGWGRKGIKYSYKEGGATGYRGKEIVSLIERMLNR